MDSKKSITQRPDPYLIDEENRPLTDKEIKGLMPAKEFFARYGRFKPVPPIPVENGKMMVTLDLDAKVVEFFKLQGDDWWVRLNDKLLEVVEQAEAAKKKAS